MWRGCWGRGPDTLPTPGSFLVIHCPATAVPLNAPPSAPCGADEIAPVPLGA
jgi:hypothetical protein